MAPARILGVCGSLQAGSANRRLLERAVALAPPGVEVTLWDGLRALPHFDPDLEVGGVPGPVAAWRAALAGADALLLASPEYGHSLPGVLKNAIDWVIPSGELEGQIVGVTASVPWLPRGERGLAALKVPLGAVSATVLGGVPIPRGPDEDRLLRGLIDEIVTAVRARADAAS